MAFPIHIQTAARFGSKPLRGSDPNRGPRGTHAQERPETYPLTPRPKAWSQHCARNLDNIRTVAGHLTSACSSRVQASDQRAAAGIRLDQRL